MKKTTLIIQDEVNCSFAGLEAKDRQILYKRNKVFNPANRYVTSCRLGRWDGCNYYFTMGGNTYINLLEPILEYLISEGYDINIQDNRTYNRDFKFDPIDEQFLKNCHWPENFKNKTIAGKPIILKPHQVNAANIFLNNLQGISQLPTGSGKTLLVACLSKKVEKYGRSIVIVPNKDLITQTEESYKMIGLDVGVYYGDRKDFFKTHTICTWQSLQKLKESPIDIGLDEPVTFQKFTQNVTAVIVDECLAPGTKISTPKGLKNIENLNIGDDVYSYDETSKKFVIEKIIDVYHNMEISKNEKMYELVMENGNKLHITGNHKVLTQRGWIEAKHLLLTDEIINFNNENLKKSYTKTALMKDKINSLLSGFRLKIIEYSSSKIILNNGLILNKKESKNFKCNLKKGKFNLDKFYAFDEKIRNNYRKESRHTGYIPWNKGKTKETDERLLKISVRQTGNTNSFFGKRRPEEYKIASSNHVKQLILDGKFTPKTENRLTHRQNIYKNISFRSSWEAAWFYLNPNFEFEKIRISYISSSGIKRVYIIDFSDSKQKILVEIKPKELTNKRDFPAKIAAAKQWAKINGWKYFVINQDYFIKNQKLIQNSDLSNDIKKRIRNIK